MTYIYSGAKHRRSGTTMQKLPLRGSLSRAERARMVMPGYPCERPFENRKEIEAYLSGDEVDCLLCGKPYQNLSRHLRKMHEVEPGDYRLQYNIPHKYALAGVKYRQRMSEISSDPRNIEHIRAWGKAAGNYRKNPRPRCRMTSKERSERNKLLPPPKPRYTDWSWHIQQVATYKQYTDLVPPAGMGSWSRFKKVRLRDQNLGALFSAARRRCGYGSPNPSP